MNKSEKERAKALKEEEKLRKELETLRKELKDCKNEKVKIYGAIGVEVYKLSKTGEIEVPQINNYLTKLEEINTNSVNRIKRIEERGFTVQVKQGHYELITNKDDKLNDTIICTCGAEISKNSKFCSFCGKKVEDLTAEPSKAEQTPVKECICGAKIQVGQSMCLECGRKIE